MVFGHMLIFLLLNRNLFICLFEENLIKLFFFKRIVIYENTASQNADDNADEIMFEFYLVKYTQILENLEQSEKLQEENFEQTLSNDLDHVWVLALKILNIFEETINSTYPSTKQMTCKTIHTLIIYVESHFFKGLRYDRFSMCPECEKFSFIGEWLTPKGS